MLHLETHFLHRPFPVDGEKKIVYTNMDRNNKKERMKSMEFSTLITERRSVRAYSEERISHEDLAAIAKAAQMAPSWKNQQASRMYIVETPEKLEELRSKGLPPFNYNNSKNAVLIVSTFVTKLVGHNDGVPVNEMGDKWGAYDLGLHDAYLILAAKNAGYDTLIMGIRAAEAIRAVLDIPGEEDIASVIAIGRRAQEPVLRPRKQPEEVIKFF